MEEKEGRNHIEEENSHIFVAAKTTVREEIIGKERT